MVQYCLRISQKLAEADQMYNRNSYPTAHEWYADLELTAEIIQQIILNNKSWYTWECGTDKNIDIIGQFSAPL